MRYTDETLHFSFELPEGWRHDRHIRPLTFFGPVGGRAEHIQIRTGHISPQYRNVAAREVFMVEPGATVRRGSIAGEDNVVICEWADHTEISIVREDVHYTIVHPHEATTPAAVARMLESFSFAPSARVAEVIEQHRDPGVRAVADALHAGSAEEARTILRSSEAVEEVRGRHGSTMYRVKNTAPKRRRWWQFWRT